MASVKARILGIDYGRARIGLAIAESPCGMAHPLETLTRINRNEDMRRLREIACDQSVKLIVVGMPLRLDGSLGEMAEEAKRFAGRIRKQVGVPVELADERLTSWEAERLLEEEYGRRPKAAGRASKKKRGTVTIDSMAAVIILRDYLSRRSGPAGGALA